MDGNLEKDCGALGSLFVQIMNDMKASSPIWEDFIAKATKLHVALKATLLATSAFLEAFQKVADMATNTRGASRDIGSALTRLCLRHRSIENKLKHFTMSLIETLINPLQEKSDEWKKNLVQLDKEHSKEYKRARQEIKRASSDTVRLQKKAKKGKAGEQQRLEHALQDVHDKFYLLEETEKKAVRGALIEERARFCLFVTCLKPVVDQEVAMLSEVTHLQEVTQSLCLQAGEPNHLPPASEQVILDLKGSDPSTWTFNTPPSSPSSLGSRKSSMCSISSINSSSSGSTQSHSPSHHVKHRTTSQPPATMARLSSISSQDSGFTSLDTLFHKPPSPSSLETRRKSCVQGGAGSGGDGEAAPSSPLASSSASTWANWPEPPNAPTSTDPPTSRPHTISGGYQRSRPALSNRTYDAPDNKTNSTSPYAVPCIVPPAIARVQQQSHYQTPNPPVKTADIKPPAPGPKARSKPVAPPTVPKEDAQSAENAPPHVYVNTKELVDMAGKNPEEAKATDKGGEKEKAVGNQNTDTSGDNKRQPPRRSNSLLGQYDSAPLRQVIAELHHTPTLRPLSVDKSPVKQEPSRDSGGADKTSPTKTPNSHELAEAIKELEASTAALERNYDSSPKSPPAQAPPGYGTLPPTALLAHQKLLEGIGPGQSATLMTRRASLSTPKPAPPIRRTNSLCGPTMFQNRLLTTAEQDHTEPDETSPDDSGDDLPLPPPPDELLPNGNADQVDNPTTHHNQKIPGEMRPPMAQSMPTSIDTSHQHTDIEAQSVLLMSQLKFGVTLKKTVSDDRSAPRFT